MIVVSPNAGSVEATMDIPDFSNGFSFPTTIVQQNTTSVLFHEIGERNTTDISYRGSVIDYENSARRLIKLPLRPYDLNHSYKIKTNYNK